MAVAWLLAGWSLSAPAQLGCSAGSGFGELRQLHRQFSEPVPPAPAPSPCPDCPSERTCRRAGAREFSLTWCVLLGGTLWSQSPCYTQGLSKRPRSGLLRWSDTKPESPFQQHPADQGWFKHSWWNILPFTKDNSFCSLRSMTDASCILYTTVLADILPSFHHSTRPKPRDTLGSRSSHVYCLLLPTFFYRQDILEVRHFVLSDRNKNKPEFSHHLILGPRDRNLTQWKGRRKFSRQWIHQPHLGTSRPTPPTSWLICLGWRTVVILLSENTIAIY